MFVVKIKTFTFKYFGPLKMKIFAFSIIFALSNANVLPAASRQQNKSLWAKLENYGRVTGLSNEKILSIWEKSLKMQTESNQGYK